MTRLRWWLGGLIAGFALWVAPEIQMFPASEDDERMSAERWAGLLILHAEAIHGCQHTGQARRELGMAGPRGEAA